MRMLDQLRFASALALLLLMAPEGSAQIKLTGGGPATLAGNVGGGVTTQSPTDGALSTVVQFGDVGPANPNAFVCFTQPVFIRASVPSSVRLALTTAVFGVPPAAIKKTDLGVGIRNLVATGVNSSIATTTIVPAFSADPCAAPKNADGIPSYSATLNSLPLVLPGTTVIQSTGPISLAGGMNSVQNRVRFDLKMAIAPQFYAAGNFSAVLTVTITSP